MGAPPAVPSHINKMLRAFRVDCLIKPEAGDLVVMAISSAMAITPCLTAVRDNVSSAVGMSVGRGV